MLEWWNSLSFIQQILGAVAIPSTVILLIQTIAVAASGFDGDGDIDTVDVDDVDDISSFDAAGVQIFTIRGFITFFCIFGWSGIWLLGTDLGTVISFFVAFLLGASAMMGTAYLVKFFLTLQDKGNQNINDALGSSGTVYINVPKDRNGLGKVTAIVSGRLSEFDAMTDDEEDLKTGASVTIISITEPNILIVTKK